MIVSPITPHSKRIYSHRAGWGRLWSAQLGAPMAFDGDYSKADTIYLDHGMEFRPDSKGLNYFLKTEESYDKLAERLEQLQNFRGRVVSLDIPCPLYGSRAKSRLCDGASVRFKALDFDRIDEVCQSADTLRQEDLGLSKLIIGDSHSISAWQPEYAISRNDGQTLYGALKKGFGSFIEPHAGTRLHTLRTYFGNIDVRFHIHRQSDPRAAMKALVIGYIDELCRVQQEYAIPRIEVMGLLPIEDESRVLPRTGWYKGQPFYGSWYERNAYRLAINASLAFECRMNGFEFIQWPDSFLNDKDQLDFEVMEKPRSVHIAPSHYLWKI